MGLDQYLNRMPRYKNVTANQISAMESYFEWTTGDNTKKYSFNKWCGHDLSELPSIETIEYFRQFYSVRYSDWDVEKKFGFGRIMDQIGYWRKANHIHRWFVENVQDGIDDCNYHHEVTEEVLENILDACIEVLNSSVMTIGAVNNGCTIENGELKDNIEIGKVIIDPSIAKNLLPTTGGFFFGSTDYDEYYVEGIKETIDICQNALATTDFEKEMIYYVSSW